jgi:amino acid adenylation domain-containing protein
VAAVHGGRFLTYAELDDRVNRIGQMLLAHGLQSEDVVAVVTERTLDWMASVLAVLRAGGTYLPVEPGFPADRIAAMLRRSGCRIALTEPGSTTTFDRALAQVPGVHVIGLDTVDHSAPARPLDVAVRADQLAYLYFTSGSTGEPKGALCEHAGLLNHVYAKIHDLNIRECAVVAQTAPQCFDISLWQLVAALLVGGRTVLVDQEAILDVDLFLDTLEEHRVEILQVVPSYLDVVLARLEAEPRDLPDLRCVSVTGEPLPRDLVRRWFAARPDVPLVNAYGLTETCDDTNHEVMSRDPDGDRIPLGRPIANVHVYVVDDRLRPVPLGAPGEIVFSGVCVGRGYVNDPERTAEAFLGDPLRPGERLYRSGDIGRWRPDGKLEFLGRRDSQVKVRGFRVEIGEVETALTRQPGVRQAGVVVDDTTGSARLIGFLTGDPSPDSALDSALDLEDLRSRLAQTLPSYMVPSLLREVPELPLTTNGKVDKTRLRAEAQEARPRDATALSPAETKVAGAWAELLGVPLADLGPDAHFADLGATSLTAVRLVVALDRAVTLRQVRTHPVLADLARLLEGTPR